MVLPTIEPLGPATLNRKWRVEVNTGTAGSPVWTYIGGRSDFQAGLNPSLSDETDFDSNGWKSQSVTANAWKLTMKVLRKSLPNDSTQYDPGQEFLRVTALTMGVENSVQVRWYEAGDARVEAYEGFATVSWSLDGGAPDAFDIVSVTLDGQGQMNAIAHPYPLVAVAPTVTSIAPVTGGVAGGTLVEITGSGFTGATGVKFGTTAATQFDVQSDSTIFVVSPAQAAGAQQVTVTTAAGTSATNAGTTFTYA